MYSESINGGRLVGSNSRMQWISFRVQGGTHWAKKHAARDNQDPSTVGPEYNPCDSLGERQFWLIGLFSWRCDERIVCVTARFLPLSYIRRAPRRRPSALNRV